MAFRQISRKVGRAAMKGKKQGTTIKLLSSHGRPLKAIVENRERYAAGVGRADWLDETAKWRG